MTATWIPLGGWSLVSGSTTYARLFSDYLNEGKKANVRTIQETLRHENPEMTLAKYTESSLESRLAAQDVMADAIFPDPKQVQ